MSGPCNISVAAAGFSTVVAVTFALGVGDAGTKPAQPTAVTEIVPLCETTLPYEGQGTVAILDDGGLIIKVGGEVVFEETSEDEDIVRVTPGEAVAYRLDTSGLRLVSRDGRFFLDKDGIQIRARGLADEGVEVVSFKAADEIDRDAARQAVLQLTGKLNLSIDVPSRRLALKVADSHGIGRTFELTAYVASQALSRTSPDSLSLPPAPEVTDDDHTLVLYQREDSASTCSASCPRESCSVTCLSRGCGGLCLPGGGAYCYCSSEPSPTR